MKNYFILLLILTTNTFSQSTQNAENTVNKALTALTNADIQTLVSLTQNSELRKAQELLEYIGTSDIKKKEVLNQYKSLKSWKITGSQQHSVKNRDIIIVNTEWIISPTLETVPGSTLKNEKELQDKTVFVDYMLERFGNEWKIISKRTLN